MDRQYKPMPSKTEQESAQIELGLEHVTQRDSCLELPSSAPFTYELNGVEPSILQKMNAKNGFKGARAYRPAQEAIALMNSRDSATGNRLKSWLYHPDERVRDALLRHPSILPSQPHFRSKRFTNTVLYHLSMLDIEERGLKWNPVLDLLDSKGLWPRRNLMDTYYSSKEFVENAPVKKAFQTDVAALARGVAQWINNGGKQKRERLLMLSDFKSRNFLDGIFRHLENPAWEDIKPFLERRPPFVAGLGDNPKVSQETLDSLAHWLVDRLASTVSSEDPSLEKDETFGRSAQPMYHAAWSLMKSHSRPLYPRVSYQGKFSFSPKHFDRLVSFLDTEGLEEQKFKEVFNTLLLCKDDLSPPQLLALVELCSDSYHAESIARAASATPDVWFVCLQKSTSPALRAELSAKKKARQDPRIRPFLMRSSQADVAVELLSTATGEEFRKIFKKLGRRHAPRAVELLKERDDLESQLEAKDLVPLLKSEHREVRVFATTWIGNLKHDTSSTTKKHTIPGRKR